MNKSQEELKEPLSTGFVSRGWNYSNIYSLYLIKNKQSKTKETTCSELLEVYSVTVV